MNIDQKLFPKSGLLQIDNQGNVEATIVDAELDEIDCIFENDGCVTLITEGLGYIMLTPENLKLLQNLIFESELHYSK